MVSPILKMKRSHGSAMFHHVFRMRKMFGRVFFCFANIFAWENDNTLIFFRRCVVENCTKFSVSVWVWICNFNLTVTPTPLTHLRYWKLTTKWWKQIKKIVTWFNFTGSVGTGFRTTKSTTSIASKTMVLFRISADHTVYSLSEVRQPVPFSIRQCIGDILIWHYLIPVYIILDWLRIISIGILMFIWKRNFHGNG